MPFQPYQSDRGPDFISLALQLRREQRQEESQNRRDEAALIRARSQAENDALSRAKTQIDIFREYTKGLPDASERAGVAQSLGDTRVEQAPEFLTNPEFQGPLQLPDEQLQQAFPTPESFAVTQYPELSAIAGRRANMLVQSGVDPSVAQQQAVRDLGVEHARVEQERERERKEKVETERRAARSAMVSPSQVDDRAREFAYALERAPRGPERDELLEDVSQYARLLSRELDEPFEDSVARLDRRMNGVFARRQEEQGQELRNRRIELGGPDAVASSVNGAVEILEQLRLAEEMPASKVAELQVTLGSLRSRTVAAIAETRGISQKEAQKVYDGKLNAASAGRFNELQEEKRTRNALTMKVDAAQREIDDIEQKLENLGEGSEDTPQYRKLQRRLQNAQAVKSKLLNEDLASENPVLTHKQFTQQDVGLLQTVTGISADLGSMAQLAATDRSFLGSTSGGLMAAITEAVEQTTDIGNVFLKINSSLGRGVSNNILADVEMDAETKKRLYEDLGFDDGGQEILEKRTDAKVLVSRMAYAYTRMLNPGRFSDAQYRNNLSLFDFTEGSSAKALTKLKAGIAEMRRAQQQLTDRVPAYNVGTTVDSAGNVRDANTYEIILRAPEAQSGSGATNPAERVGVDEIKALLAEDDL